MLGEPLVSVVAFGSKYFNILRLCDALSAKGWNLNPLQKPARYVMTAITYQFLPDIVAFLFVTSNNLQEIR